MIYIFDKTQSIIKVLTNDDFTAAHLNFKINTATTFEFSLPASKALPSGSKYVATPHPLDDSKFIMLRLTERVDNAETIDYSAYELAYQELATDGYIEDKRPQNQSALNLMKIALDGSNWELNNVNVSGAATTNFYYVDHLSAISNVVDLLGGEIVFYIEIQGNTISGRYMDYLARQGADTSKVFASGSNLLTVERQSDTSNIYTAILPRGKGEEIDNGEVDTPDGYGRRINIADVEWKKSSGKPLDKPKGSIVLSDPDATAEWGQINGNARLLLQTYDDIDDVNVLISSAYKTLQSVNHPQIQYSATVADVGGLSLGDTVLIMHGDRDLSYKTRVFEVKYDLLAPDQTELSLGDDLSSNSITSQINSLNAVADTTSSQTQWTINQIGRPSTTFGNTEPANPKVGDVFFKGLPDGGTEIYRWNGDIWELLASPTTADDIAAAVTDAVTQARSMDAELNQSINDDINATMTTVNNSLAVLDSEASSFKSEADSATSSVASSVSALMTTTTASLAAYASSATSSANKALSSAAGAASSAATALSQAGVNSLATSSVASDVNGLKASYTSLNSSAGVLTSQTASLAVSASSASAQFDKVSSTTGSLATETAALKVSASSASAQFDKVNSSAGSLATQAASLAVSASSAAIGISNVTSSAGSLATQTASLAVSASSFSTSITSMSSQNGSQATAISALTQRADGFDFTVSKVNNLSVGGRNYLTDTSKDYVIAASSINNYNYKRIYTELLSGKTYTFSAEVVTTGTGSTGLVTVSIYNRDLSTGYSNMNMKADGTRQSLTFKVPDGLSDNATLLIYSGEFTKTANSGATYTHMKLEDGNVPTAWSPAPEDIDAQFATQKITIDGITSTVSKQTSDIDAVTNRVQTAEGSISTATNNITGLQSSQTQTANQLQTEITDRTTGDSNTLTQSKSFTTSQITSYDTGIQSQFTQTSNAILASIESTNLVVNSEFDPLNGTWYAFTNTVGSALGAAWSAVASDSFSGWPVVNGSRVIAYSAGQAYSTALKPTSAGKVFSASIVVGRASATTATTFDFRIAFWDSSKKLISNLGSTNPVNGTSYVGAAKYATENITSPTGTAYVSLVIAHSSGNAQDFITRPMLNYGAKAAAYSPTYGTTSSSTVLSLMKDNYSFGINASGQLVSGISGNEELLTLTGKAIHLDGETTVDGDFYAKGGNFKNLNASEIKTGTINASLINVINLNANNITTGAINGANLTINLDTGQVVFQKGRLYRSATAYSQATSKNETIYPIDVNLDSGYMAVESANSKILLKDGGISLTQPNFLTATTNPYLDISNKAVTGFTTNPSASLIASDMILLSTQDGANEVWTLPFLDTTETFTGFYSGQVGTSTNLTKVGGGTNGVVIAGGSAMTSDGNHSPAIIVGSNGTGSAVGSNRVYISAQYFHLPATYTRTGSTSANLYVAADGAVLRSSSSSRFKLNIEYETDAGTAEQLLTLNPATWDDKFETEQTDRLHETGEETDIAINKRRYYGIIAEDLVKANLDYLVQRNEQTNEVDGVEYAKIGVALIPIIRELRDRINEQALEIERLKEITK